MLTTRRNSWFSLTAITILLILIIHSLPVLAGSRFFSFSRHNYLPSAHIIADNSLVTTKQHPSNLLYHLNLTNTQQEQIKRIHYRYKQELSKKRHSLGILQKQLSDLMVGTESVELIRAKNQQLVNLRQEISNLRFETMLATREILTPQQRLKFREIVEAQLDR